MNALLCSVFTFLVTSLGFISIILYEKVNKLESIILVQGEKIKLMEKSVTVESVVIKATELNNSIDFQPLVNSIPYIICIGGGVFVFWYISSAIGGMSLIKLIPSLSSFIPFLNLTNSEKIMTDTSGNLVKLIISDGKAVELLTKLNGTQNFVPYILTEKVIERATESSVDMAYVTELASKINF